MFYEPFHFPKELLHNQIPDCVTALFNNNSTYDQSLNLAHLKLLTLSFCSKLFISTLVGKEGITSCLVTL